MIIRRILYKKRNKLSSLNKVMKTISQKVIRSLDELNSKDLLMHHFTTVIDLMESNEDNLPYLENVYTKNIYNFKSKFERFYTKWYKQISRVEQSLLGYYFILTSYYPISKIILNHKDSIQVDLFNTHRVSKENVQVIYDLVKSNIKSERFFNKFGHFYEELSYNITVPIEECLKLYNDLSMGKLNQSISNIGNILNEINIPSIPDKFIKNSIKKKTRKSITRATDLFKRIIGKKEIEAFIHGEEFLIEGNRYNYIVKNNNNLISATENLASPDIPYELSLFHKNGNKLANCCITFEHTPIIDQVIAFYLHIKSGNEENLLKEMNFFNKSDSIWDDEYLVKLKKYSSSETRQEVSRGIYYEDQLFIDLVKKVGNKLLKPLNIPSHIRHLMLEEKNSFYYLSDYFGVGMQLPIKKQLNLIYNTNQYLQIQ